jgi:hypothetical protein
MSEEEIDMRIRLIRRHEFLPEVFGEPSDDKPRRFRLDVPESDIADLSERLGHVCSSFGPRMHGPWPIPNGGTLRVPTGYCEFPPEILLPPRSLAARIYTDIRRWMVMARGRHFAAMKQPEALAGEVRAFLKPLRAGSESG